MSEASGLESNAEIIARWRERWNPDLMLFLRRRVAGAVDADDIAQETYMRLLRARGLAEVQKPCAYLLRVARHALVDWRSQQPTGSSLPLEDDDWWVAGDLACECDAQWSLARLDNVLSGISAVTREVLLLRFREDLSRREIARTLSLTERQVQRHMLKGYGYLRDRYQELQS